MDSTTQKLNDFGEIIGGARKEFYADIKIHGLTSAAYFKVPDLSAADLKALVNIKNIWPADTVTWQTYLDNEISRSNVYFVYLIHEFLVSKVKCPTDVMSNPEKLNYYREECGLYITCIEDIRSHLLSSLESGTLVPSKWIKDFLGAYPEYLRKNKLQGGANLCFSSMLLKFLQSSCYTTTDSLFVMSFLQDFPNVTNINIKYMYFNYVQQSSGLYTLNIYTFKKLMIGSKKFYFSVLSLPNVDKETLDKEIKEPQLLKNRFNDLFAKISATSDFNSKNAKQPLLEVVRPPLQMIIRTGPDIRHNAEIVADDLLKEFQLRGGEFGNWLSQKDRQASLNYFYDAMWDLAYVLNISVDKIAFKDIYSEPLAIAFGSRGVAKASAHFEPLKFVINLTKLSGAGSLAHEYGHAFDAVLGSLLMKKNSISTHGVYGLINMWHRDPNSGDEKVQALSVATVNLMFSIMYAHSPDGDLFDGMNIIPDSLNFLKDSALKYGVKLLKTTSNYSNFYSSAAKLDADRKKPYYSTLPELIARAFETYIYYKLPYSSYYLVYGLVNFDNFVVYPEGEEREIIFKAIDQLINMYKICYDIPVFVSPKGLSIESFKESSEENLYNLEYSRTALKKVPFEDKDLSETKNETENAESTSGNVESNSDIRSLDVNLLEIIIKEKTAYLSDLLSKMYTSQISHLGFCTYKDNLIILKNSKKIPYKKSNFQELSMKFISYFHSAFGDISDLNINSLMIGPYLFLSLSISDKVFLLADANGIIKLYKMQNEKQFRN